MLILEDRDLEIEGVLDTDLDLDLDVLALKFLITDKET